MNTTLTNKLLWTFVSISGAFSVLFGAWLAHAGQGLEPEIYDRLASAQLYQFIHTVTLLVLCLHLSRVPNNKLVPSSVFFVVGIICFSGSLYVKTWLPIPWIGNLAPFGGVCLALGWLSLLINLIKEKK